MRQSLRSPGLIVMSLAIAVAWSACSRGYDTSALTEHRRRKDEMFRTSPASPFNASPKVEFSPLKYFPPDPSLVFRSRLYVFPQPERVQVLDTQGNPFAAEVYGYLALLRNGTSHRLRVHRLPGPIPGAYRYAIWFTDRTSGETTYEVGRYLDFTNLQDPEHVYTIDFNYAYNPFCAYSPAFACAIPREEDRLDFAVTAGERKWR